MQGAGVQQSGALSARLLLSPNLLWESVAVKPMHVGKHRVGFELRCCSSSQGPTRPVRTPKQVRTCRSHLMQEWYCGIGFWATQCCEVPQLPLSLSSGQGIRNQRACLPVALAKNPSAPSAHACRQTTAPAEVGHALGLPFPSVMQRALSKNEQVRIAMRTLARMQHALSGRAGWHSTACHWHAQLVLCQHWGCEHLQV